MLGVEESKIAYTKIEAYRFHGFVTSVVETPLEITFAFIWKSLPSFSVRISSIADLTINMSKYLWSMYHIYILSSLSRVIYVGVTGNLYKRIRKHKAGEDPKAFTTRYRIHRLVYLEEYESIQKAIEREKQIKRWRREKKVQLIESANPGWRDLSKEPGFSK